MKSNLIYIIGGIVLFAGILFSLIGFGVVNFDVEKLSTGQKYEEKTFVSSEPITSIIAKDSNIEVKIISSDDENIHIRYYESKNTKYEISEVNGIINLESKKNFTWGDGFFNFNFQDIDVVIELPKDYSGDLQVKTSNAKIYVQNVSTRNTTLSTSNSSIRIGYLNASEDINLHTSNGSMNLENLIATGEIFAETSNSSLTLRSSDSKNIDLKTSNGSINFYDIDFITKLKCKTSNGHIEGSLPGSMVDYTITSDTSNADNSLPENMNGGDKKIDIKTSNAHIDVEFEN